MKNSTQKNGGLKKRKNNADLVIEHANREKNSRKYNGEDLFINAFDHAPIGITLVSPDGKFLKVNKSLCRIVGYTEEELLSKTFMDITHPDDLEVDLNFVKQMLEGKIRTYQMEKRYFHKSGNIVRVMLSVSLVYKNNGEPHFFISQIEDITHRKKIEQDLLESEENMRALLNATTEAIFLLDSTGIVRAVNDETGRRFNLTRDDLIGKYIYDILPPEVAKRRREKVNEVVKTGKPARFIDERSGFIIDQKLQPVFNSKGEVTHIAIFGRDITAIAQAEESLRKSETLLKETQKLIKVGGWEYDVEHNSMYWTEECFRIHDFEPEEIEEKSLELINRSMECYLPEDRLIINNAFRKCVESGEPYDLELRFVTFKNRNLWIRTSARAIFVESKVKKVLGNIMDITEWKKAQDSLREADEILRTVFENSPIGLEIYDKSGLMIRANKKVKEMFEVDVEQYYGKFDLRSDPNYQYPEVWERLEKGESVSHEVDFDPSKAPYKTTKKGNSYFFIITTPIPYSLSATVGYVMQIIDITERKQSEKYLKESEERFRHAFDYSANSMCIVGLDTKFLRVNKAFINLFGYDENEIESLTFNDITHDEDRLIGTSYLIKMLSGEINYCIFEKRYFAKDKKIIFGYVSVSLVKDTNNNPQFFITQIIDITNLKTAEEALQRSEERLKIINDSSIDIIYSYDLSGRFTSVNQRMIEAMRMPESEIIGKTHQELGFPEEQCREWERLHRRIYETGKTVISQSSTPMPDGQIHHFEVVLNPLHDKNGNKIGIGGTTRDITDQKRAESALKESEERFRSIIENANDIIFSINLEGIFTYISPNWIEILGHEQYEVLDNSFELFVHPDDQQKIKGALEKLFASGDKQSGLEYRIKHKDGTWRWHASNISGSYNSDGKMISIIGIARDINSNKIAEEALRESEKRFRELFDKAPVGYHEINLEGKIIRVNATELEMLGYSHDEMLDHYIWEFIFEKIQDTINIKLLGKNNVKTAYERTFRHKNGSKIPVLMEDRLLLNSENEVTGIRSTIQDIKERKIYEAKLNDSNILLEKTLAELKDTQRMVLQQERMRALGQLASGIAHDINNSLSPILGWTDLLLDIPEVVKHAERPLNVIKKASTDISMTISRMKEFYRPRTENEFEKIDLNNIIKSTIELTRHKWKDISEQEGKVITIDTFLQQDLPQILGIESEIREALTNLVINASDAMTQGGMLSIRSMLSGENIVLEIEDTGIGMSEDTKNHCFDPFYTTKGEKGTGLGLSMVYGIVKRHDGEIRVKSQLDKGTTFRIILPMKDKLSEKVDRVPEQNNQVEIPQLKILVLDDEDDVRELVEKILDKLGHRSVSVSSGKYGIEKFNLSIAENEPFDLVITDLGMPNMDGKSFARIIKHISPETPIILLTGWGDFLERESFEEIDCVISKPITKIDLSNAILSCYKIKSN